jgi:hypothetical protein
MRILLLTALATACVFAQARGGGASVARGRSGPPPGAPRPVGSRPAGPPPVSRPYYPHYPRTVAVPYPVFIGGGYYPSYDNGSSSYQSPGAVVNPDYRPDTANPAIIDFSNAPAADAVSDVDENGLRDDQPTIFLIALTDHTVVAAIAYWVDGDTLNWVSRDAKQNRMSLTLVDRDFSKQLNDERHVEFKLPPVKE